MSTNNRYRDLWFSKRNIFYETLADICLSNKYYPLRVIFIK